ncbi:MAG TPA: hypothetical protein VGJ73_24185 [Verrucomicrobiae bacterium]
MLNKFNSMNGNSSLAITDHFYLLIGVIAFAALFLAVFLILAKMGVLNRLKNIKIKVSKEGGEGEMAFHQHGPVVGPLIEMKPPVLEVKPRGMREMKPEETRELEIRMRGLLASRKHTLRAPPQNWEAQQIEEGLDFLRRNVPINAKRRFDMVVQRNPKSVEGWFGLAQVYEKWKDLRSASVSYWEAIRIDTAHDLSAKAKERLEAISNLERQKNDGQIVLRDGPGPTSYWFKDVPDGETLARHVVALSNANAGGVIVIGCDPETRQPGTTIIVGHEVVIEAALFDYITAPSVHEIFFSPCGKWIYIKVFRGLSRPYRVKGAAEKTIFVCDGNGQVRPASPKEQRDLRQNK